MFRFNALMTPMRAIIVGPWSPTTRSRASTAALSFLEQLLDPRKLLDIIRGLLEARDLATAGQRNRINEGARPISHDAAAMTV